MIKRDIYYVFDRGLVFSYIIPFFGFFRKKLHKTLYFISTKNPRIYKNIHHVNSKKLELERFFVS